MLRCEANPMGHWMGRIRFQARPAFPRMLLPLLIARGICAEVLYASTEARLSLQINCYLCS